MLEVTYMVKNDLKTAREILENKGFVLSKYAIMSDRYFSKYDDASLKRMPYQEIIGSSVLLRRIETDTVTNYMIYKNKEYDKNGNVVNEEKVRTKLADFDTATKILSKAGLNKFADYTTHLYEYKNGNEQVCLQQIDELGLFIEHEEQSYAEGQTLKERENNLINNLNRTGLSLGKDPFIKKVELYLNKKFNNTVSEME